MCKVFHSSLILHQEAGSSEPASCIFNTYKGLSQFLIETAPFLICRKKVDIVIKGSLIVC
ncbi:hypothetical protein SAMN04490355_104082 [Pelosinus propionicus DSM 13327]|uniref:Uncharacterized protein n=1 Tax=Pelosinus propionicus DSM 13327 TaxID=1123291 RepID=A0A1I4N3E5_9FIRM|nr:hypothetical protein SAMN04490355_104082 [Pelosinus propionicus DSM 13327]